MCSRHPLYLVVFRASSQVQIFHLNVICSKAAAFPQSPRRTADALPRGDTGDTLKRNVQPRAWCGLADQPIFLRLHGKARTAQMRLSRFRVDKGGAEARPWRLIEPAWGFDVAIGDRGGLAWRFPGGDYFLSLAALAAQFRVAWWQW